MPDYIALRDAIDSDPAHDARTDAEVATSLNEPIAAPPGAVTPGQFLRWLAGGGRYEKLTRAVTFDGADEATNAAVRSLARAAMRIFDLQEPLPLDDPEIGGMIAALVGAGVFTEDDRDALTARAAPAEASSRAIRSFGLPVTEHDVAHARNL